MAVFLYIALYLFIAIFDLVFITLIFLYGLLPFVLHGAIYVATTNEKALKMIEMADLKPTDRAVDLGSGDGRLVIALARQGIEAHGYEINPILVRQSQKAIKEAGLENLASIHLKSFWDENLSGYNKVLVYGMRHMLGDLENKLKKELKPGALVVLNTFSFPNMKPEKQENNLFLYRIV